MRLGILPLGRPTFDVPYAKSKLAMMLTALDATDHAILGPRELLFDEVATLAGIEQLKAENVDQVLLLQVTFTDASMVVAAAKEFQQPLSVWAISEPRSGDRLRLNAFCGLNLASHALRRNGRQFSWLYADPEVEIAKDLAALLNGERCAGTLRAGPVPDATDAGRRIADMVRGQRIGRVGERPIGFHTCDYSSQAIEKFSGVRVDALELDDLFASAKTATNEQTLALRGSVEKGVDGLSELDQEQLDRSLRLKIGLDNLRNEGGYDAFAIRCWPETFTEYGGAICGPAGILNEAKVPCACEADVYGALTQLILMEVSGTPVFLTDLVDMDAEDDTGVVWHCGQAPLSMCNAKVAPQATVHTNRRQPLLYEFTLKPGVVTLMRISQADESPHMVLTAARMLDRPMAHTGTSGVLRFFDPVDDTLERIISSGLEHHMALAYGDHRVTLRGVAGAMNLPILEI